MRFDVINALTAYDLSTDEDVATPAFGAEGITKASFTASVTGVTGTTKSFAASLQGSLDGITWLDIGTGVVGADVAAQVKGEVVEKLCWKYIRVNFDGHANITGGVLNIKIGYVA